MNKKELIDYCESLKGDLNKFINGIDVNKIIKKIEQLDEPQKVTIPQFVADYIDFKKTYDFHVYGAMRVIEDHYDKRVQEWFYEDNVEKFCLAWLDGYEVEKEPKYTVKVKGNLGQYLGKYYLNNVELTPQFIRVKNSEPSIFTKEELEQTGFGWVFNCPGIEIEEVKG